MRTQNKELSLTRRMGSADPKGFVEAKPRLLKRKDLSVSCGLKRSQLLSGSAHSPKRGAAAWPQPTHPVRKQNSGCGHPGFGHHSVATPLPAGLLKPTYLVRCHHSLGHSKDGLDVAFCQFVRQLAHRWVVLERGPPVRWLPRLGTSHPSCLSAPVGRSDGPGRRGSACLLL